MCQYIGKNKRLIGNKVLFLPLHISMNIRRNPTSVGRRSFILISKGVTSKAGKYRVQFNSTFWVLLPTDELQM